MREGKLAIIKMVNTLSCPLRWSRKTTKPFYCAIQSMDVVNKSLESFGGVSGVSDMLGADSKAFL